MTTLQDLQTLSEAQVSEFIDARVDAHFAPVDKPAATLVAAPAAPIAQKQVQTAEQAGIRAMADALVAQGLVSREQADQWAAADMASLDQPVDPLAPLQTSGQPQAPEQPQSRQEQELRAIADTLIKQGIITPEHAEGLIRDQLGGQEETPDAPRTDVLKDVNPVDEIFERPKSPEAYQLPPFDLPLKDAEMLNAQKEVRDVLYDARLPQPVAVTIWREFETLAKTPMSNEQLVLANAATNAAMERLWGPRKDEMMGYGRRLYKELSKAHPEFYKAFELTGAGSHAVIVAHVCEHAARLYRKDPTFPGAA